MDAVGVWAIASSNDFDALNEYILAAVYHNVKHLAVQ